MKFRLLVLGAIICAISLQDVYAQFGGVAGLKIGKLGGLQGRGRQASKQSELPGWAQGANQTAQDTLEDVISTFRKKRFKAITGTRVYDAVTGDLIDDARVVFIDEDEKANYYDDGRTGNDLVAGDEIFTNVEISDKDYIGPTMQRVKESLIQALYEVDRLDPVMFRGESLMALDERQKSERSVKWKMQPASGGLGKILVEVATERPVDVPNYYVEEEKKDKKIGGESGWAKVFLDQYRIEAGNLQSEFFKVYVPQPPEHPRMEPPSGDWWPFTALQSGASSSEDFDEDGKRLAPGESAQGGPSNNRAARQARRGTSGGTRYLNF